MRKHYMDRAQCIYVSKNVYIYIDIYLHTICNKEKEAVN